MYSINITLSDQRNCFTSIQHFLSLSLSLSLSLTYTHTHTHTYIKTHIHSNTRVHTHILTRTNTHSQPHTHIKTHTHTHTNAYTLTFAPYNVCIISFIRRRNLLWYVRQIPFCLTEYINYFIKKNILRNVLIHIMRKIFCMID